MRTLVDNRNTTVAVLTTLLLLFGLRVLGQVLVVFCDAPYLPPLKEWQSGLLPYPVLLAAQVVIIILFGSICRDIARAKGFFAEPHPRLGLFLWRFGWLYLTSMICRYCIWMYINPDARWFGGTIPIVFHLVLASFLLVLSARLKRAAN